MFAESTALRPVFNGIDPAAGPAEVARAVGPAICPAIGTNVRLFSEALSKLMPKPEKSMQFNVQVHGSLAHVSCRRLSHAYGLFIRIMSCGRLGSEET